GKAAAKRRRAHEIQFIGQPYKIDICDPNNDTFSERARVAEPRLGLFGADLRITGPAPNAPPATVDEWRGHPVTRREAADLGSHSSDHASELVSRNVW